MAKRIDEETREKLFQKYKRNESNNLHSENYLLLAETYGTPKEVAEVKKIIERSLISGSKKSDPGMMVLDDIDYDWLVNSGINKYYQKLSKASPLNFHDKKPFKYPSKLQTSSDIEINRSISHLRKNDPKMLKHIKEGVPKLTDDELIEQNNSSIKKRQKFYQMENTQSFPFKSTPMNDSTSFHIHNLVVELVQKEQAKRRKKSIGKTETPKKSIGIKRKM